MQILNNVSYHRNGVSGVPFAVAVFHADGRRMVGIVFEPQQHQDNPYTAVLDLDLLGTGVIAAGENSWRGDEYDPWLRRGIRRYWPWAEAGPEVGIPPGTPESIRCHIERVAATLLCGA